MHLNCIVDTQYKLNILIPVSKRFVTLMIGVSYAPIVAIINVINGKILNPA